MVVRKIRDGKMNTSLGKNLFTLNNRATCWHCLEVLDGTPSTPLEESGGERRHALLCYAPSSVVAFSL
jgi:hypothetical protein